MFKISQFLYDALHELVPVVVETVENKDKLAKLKDALKDPAHLVADAVDKAEN